jgi:conjugative coupling factor TraD (TOL family)
LDSKQIPKSKSKLFLGLGFEWRARHTQRLVDLDRREFDYHKDRSKSSGYVVARKAAAQLKKIKVLAPFGHLIDLKHWFNPVAPIPYTEGNPAFHAVGLWEGEEPVCEEQSERVAHKFVVGTTRVGKTRLAEVFIDQDIQNGEVVIVFDPKGDAELLKRCYISAVRAGREHQFYCFHLGYPEISARYNPIGSFGRVTEPASRVASQLPGEGQSATFREFVWRYVNVISKALVSIGKTISYEALNRYGADIDPLLTEYLEFIFSKPEHLEALRMAGAANWKRSAELLSESIKPDKNQASRDRHALAMADIYKRSGIDDPTASALIKTFEYEKAFYDKLVASLFPLLEKLTSGPAGKLLSPDYLDMDDKRPIFDWDTVIRTGGIVYIGLDALSDAEVAQAVGNSMFSDLTSRAGAIYKFGVNQGLPEELARLAPTRKICVHADEFNELVGKEFVPMANKAGGSGFQLTVYTQTLSDIEARFGSAAKAGQVIGNLGNLIMLRVKEKKTAELLTDLLPDVEVNQLMTVSSAMDDVNPETTTDFTSGTQQRIASQRVRLLTPGDITRLPKGHAFAMLGGTLHKLRIPQFKPEGDMPENLAFLYTDMKKRYASAAQNENWYRLAEYSNLPELAA